MRVDTTSAASDWGDQQTDSSTATVRSNESTLAQVAARLGISPEILQSANPQVNPNGLTAGMDLRLPASVANGSPTANVTTMELPADTASAQRMDSHMDGLAMRAMLDSAMPVSNFGSGGITQEPPVADPIHGEGYSSKLKNEIKDKLNELYKHPEFTALTQHEKSALMQALASHPPITKEMVSKMFDLIHAAKGLSPENHKLVMDAFRAGHANPAYATSLKKLIEDPKFKSLTNPEKTAVLSQVRNYPDARTVGNIDRMLHKQWFTDQSPANQQRSLKTIARLSHYEKGDRKIIDNTLNQLLDPGSNLKLAWRRYPDDDEGTHYGKGGDDTVTLNKNMVTADNDKMEENEDTDHLTFHTVAHEVNHLVNADQDDDGFMKFNDEYRAWVTGFRAEHGRMPSLQEVMDERIKDLFDPTTKYGKNARDAMKDPAEAQRFYDFLSKLTGMKVDAHNWKDVVNKSKPEDWPNLSVLDANQQGMGNHDNS